MCFWDSDSEHSTDKTVCSVVEIDVVLSFFSVSIGTSSPFSGILSGIFWNKWWIVEKTVIGDLESEWAKVITGFPLKIKILKTYKRFPEIKILKTDKGFPWKSKFCKLTIDSQTVDLTANKLVQ